MDAKKTDLVKLPVFSGKDGEDYLEFKEKMEKGLIHNRVSRVKRLLLSQELRTVDCGLWIVDCGLRTED